MAIQYNENIKIAAPNPLDKRYLSVRTLSGSQLPYSATTEVNTTIISGERYSGLTVNVNNVEYWYCGGILNSNLVQKTMGGAGTLTGATNGLSLVDGGTVVALGGSLTSGTTINGVGVHNLTISNINEFQVSTSGVTPTLIGLDSTGILLSTSNTSVSLDASEGLIYGSGYTSSNPYWIPTKLYVDGVAIGLNVHPASFLATTGDTVLSGLTVIDGVSATTGMRILVKNQLDATQNGIYSASTGIWNRTPDYNFTPLGEISNGDLIPVTSGQTQYNSLWALTSPNPVSSGQTLTFTLFSMPTNFIGGTGIDVNINTISLDAAVQAMLNAAITGVTDAGGGESVYSGTSGHDLILNTIIGSGGTTVQKVGDEIVIYSMTGVSGGDLYTYASPSICPTGGMCVGTVLTGKTALKLLQEILVPELCGVLTPPSFSTTLVASTTYYEIGCNIPSLSVCGTFSRGCINPQYMSTSDKRVGYAACYIYTGAQVAGTYISSACTISQSVSSYVLTAVPETWGITVCYGAGVQPLGQNGTPFNSACPASILSDSKTICGVYPVFATTVAIGTLTKQPYVSMGTSSVQLTLVAESGGSKDKFEIPNSWTGNPLKCVCTYNTFSSAWEFEGGSGAASLTTWTPSVTSETLCCGSAPYCLYTYNGANRLTTTCIRLVF
jgi:hypothetical protein